jgi:hypothetical protein
MDLGKAVHSASTLPIYIRGFRDCKVALFGRELGYRIIAMHAEQIYGRTGDPSNTPHWAIGPCGHTFSITPIPQAPRSCRMNLAGPLCSLSGHQSLASWVSTMKSKLETLQLYHLLILSSLAPSFSSNARYTLLHAIG